MALAAGCKKGEGKGCFKPSECDEGLACVGDDVMRCEKCEDRLGCKKSGKCSAKNGVCAAESDDDCKKSYDCKSLGPCTAKDGACVVGSDADCKASEACAKDQYCVAKGNNCIKEEKKEEKKPDDGDGEEEVDPEE